MNYQPIKQTLGLTHARKSLLDLIEITRKGLPRKAIDTLAECLHITISELAKYLHVSERTLQRYAPDKLLSTTQSDHLLQITKVYTRSLEVFEDANNATC